MSLGRWAASIDQPAVFQLEHEVLLGDESSVVGDHDQGAAALGLMPAEDPEDLVAGSGVELSGRLVGEDQDRVLEQARAIATRCCWPPESWEGR